MKKKLFEQTGKNQFKLNKLNESKKLMKFRMDDIPDPNYPHDETKVIDNVTVIYDYDADTIVKMVNAMTGEDFTEKFKRAFEGTEEWFRLLNDIEELMKQDAAEEKYDIDYGLSDDGL